MALAARVACKCGDRGYRTVGLTPDSSFAAEPERLPDVGKPGKRVAAIPERAHQEEYDMNRQQPETPRFHTLRACCAATVLAAGTATVAATDAPTVMPEQQIQRVSVQDVQLDDGGVRALVVNRSEDRLEDLTLRVTYRWRWTDEFHPGPDSAGFSDTLHLDTPLAPGERREVRYDPPQALPDRADGRFSPQITVVSFTAYDGSGERQAPN